MGVAERVRSWFLYLEGVEVIWQWLVVVVSWPISLLTSLWPPDWSLSVSPVTVAVPVPIVPNVGLLGVALTVLGLTSLGVLILAGARSLYGLIPGCG